MVTRLLRSSAHNSSYPLTQSPGSARFQLKYSVQILRGTETYDGHLADIWSSGVVLYACTQGQLPWDDACEECEEFIDYLNGEFTFPSNMSPGLQGSHYLNYFYSCWLNVSSVNFAVDC